MEGGALLHWLTVVRQTLWENKIVACDESIGKLPDQLHLKSVIEVWHFLLTVMNKSQYISGYSN